MRELERGDRALGRDERGDPRERRDLTVVPQAEVLRADPPFGRDRGRLEDDEACAADGTGAEVDEVPVVREAVLGRVLAHRRDADPVREGDGAEAEGAEERHRRIVREPRGAGDVSTGEMVKLLLWLLLLVVCWPLAILALVLYPFLWLLSIPFKVVGAVLEGLVALVRALFLLPARLLGGGARA